MQYLIFLLPWLELFTLIQLGVQTSALAALAYVFVTLVLGLAILRRQGEGMFQRLREAQEGRILGPQLLLDDMAMGLAGLLLMIPGLITDFTAVVVMIGPLRRRLARALVGSQPDSRAQRREGDSPVTLEGQYRRLDEDDNT